MNSSNSNTIIKIKLTIRLEGKELMGTKKKRDKIY